MKLFSLFILLSVGFLQSCNQNSKRELSRTSDSSAATNGSANISAGKIQMDGELPSKQSISALFNEMDYQQAVQCYLWGLPVVSMEKFKEDQEKIFGASSFDLVAYNSLEDRLGILTANATTPYILSFIDLGKTGPLVIQMPAGRIAGGLSDCWQRELVSLGETGADKGKGGKYILLPPGQTNFKAPGYFTISCSTMNVYLGLRALDPDPKQIESLIQGVKIYPYAQRSNPPPDLSSYSAGQSTSKPVLVSYSL